jgi:cytochrome P450
MTQSVQEPDALLAEILLSEEGRADPYPRYAALREVAPVHRTEALGVWFVTSYELCRHVLRDGAFGKHPAGTMPGFGFAEDADRSQYMTEFRRASMLFLDPPDHTRLRGLVNREFTPKRVDGLRLGIRRMLTPILDRMAEERVIDVMDVLAFRLPVAVIGELVGVPEADRESFRPLVRASTALIEPGVTGEALDAAAAAQQTMRNYFRALVDEKRRRPGDDLLSALIAVEADGDRLSETELIANVILLFAAGFETTTNLIGNGLWTLLTRPDQLGQARAMSPAEMTGLVEEVLRFESPVQLDARYVQRDTEIGGAQLAAGETVITLLGAANRDPGRFSSPDRVEPPPGDNQPLSFGFGIHHCLGAQLARAEGQEVFTALLERFPNIEARDASPQWRGGITLRGLEHLTVDVRT